MSTLPEEDRARRLLEVGRTLVTELDLDAVLDRVLDTAREVTGARYAAIGGLNDRRTERPRFLTSGIDRETQRAIGDLPAMAGVLKVPIAVRGQTWGELYLAEKLEGEFTGQDEEVAAILADWAAVAIGNARLYEVSEDRRAELERAVTGLEATRDVALAIGGEIQLDPVLELIAERGRALVSARSLVIVLHEGEELVVRASAGHSQEARGARLAISDSTSGQVLEHQRPQRIADVSARLSVAAGTFGVSDAKTALLVPMIYRGSAMGVLAAFDRGEQGAMFTADDEQMLRTFAVSAATAVAMAQSVQADRLRSSMAAAEAERRRWARELHDETLQGLGGLRLLLAGALRRDDLAQTREAMREAVDRIEQEIGNLRSIISDLRPAALDELGLRTALEALLHRHRERSELQIEYALSLPGPTAGLQRLEEGVEIAVYRVVQEALTNVVKHSGASHVRVAVGESEEDVLVEVQDDGSGFEPATVARGYGLAGMHERVGLVGGDVRIQSGDRGTLVSARVPIRRREAARAPVGDPAAGRSA